MKYKTHLFVWSGANQQNKIINGEMNAISPNFVKAFLFQQGITPMSVRKKRILFFSKTYANITWLDIILFLRQLATLIIAGVPILQSLDTLLLSQEKLSFKFLLQTIKNEIAAGKQLAASLKKFPAHFNNLSCQLIFAGEKSGTLDVMLNRAANYLEKNYYLKRQIKQALFYPATITLVALAVTLIMLIFVVPRFEELFLSMHCTLPAFTSAILFISNSLRYNAWLLTIPIFIYLLFIYHFKKSIRTQERIDLLLLKLPGIKHLTQKIVLSRLFRSLATLIASGIPMTDALAIAAETCNNHVYHKAVIMLRTEINAGRQLHTIMHNQLLFPNMAIQMIKIGEESGSLNTMLDKIAELYENDISYLVSHINHLLEPLIMLVLGVLIGGLVIALYLPIFKLGTVI